jgi:hypothetical protein
MTPRLAAALVVALVALLAAAQFQGTADLKITGGIAIPISMEGQILVHEQLSISGNPYLADYFREVYQRIFLRHRISPLRGDRAAQAPIEHHDVLEATVRLRAELDAAGRSVTVGRAACHAESACAARRRDSALRTIPTSSHIRD